MFEKDRFIIKGIPTVDEIDAFLCTNGFQTIVSAEGSVVASCGCTMTGKITKRIILLDLHSYR